MWQAAIRRHGTSSRIHSRTQRRPIPRRTPGPGRADGLLTRCWTSWMDETERGRDPMSGARVFAIANQKGGVGKTTTSINLAAYLANLGRKTLVIDMDPQSNTTTGLGIDPDTVQLSMYELLVQSGLSVRDVMVSPQQRPNLWLLPAKVDLYAADIELVYISEGREYRLKQALEP